MRPENYFFFRDAYGLSSLSRDLGLEITSNNEPDARYVLPEGRINLYNQPFTLKDFTHPFRPSDEVLAEFFVEENGVTVEKYLSGDLESFEELDREIMNSLETDEFNGYFKQIL